MKLRVKNYASPASVKIENASIKEFTDGFRITVPTSCKHPCIMCYATITTRRTITMEFSFGITDDPNSATPQPYVDVVFTKTEYYAAFGDNDAPTVYSELSSRYIHHLWVAKKNTEG